MTRSVLNFLEYSSITLIAPQASDLSWKWVEGSYRPESLFEYGKWLGGLQAARWADAWNLLELEDPVIGRGQACTLLQLHLITWDSTQD